MLKRTFDILVSAIGLALASPLLFPVMFLVWLEDRHSPFYIAPRVGRYGRQFRMVKMRSMVIDAGRQGVSSTANNDIRITPVGHFIRKYKIDELTQLWNVLMGDMSFVGPRPQVQSGVDIYTSVEQELLAARPGITDIASIVFSDEGGILNGSADPDLAYNQLIRPWKSRLGILYVKRCSFLLDIHLISLTLLAVISRKWALIGVGKLLDQLGVDDALKKVARREEKLTPYPPPGANNIVVSLYDPLPGPLSSNAQK